MNLNEIQDLIKFVAKSGVSEVEIERKDFKITIKSEDPKNKKKKEEQTIVIPQGMMPQMQMPQAVPQQVAATPAAPATSTAPAPAVAPEAADDAKYVTIKSPMIGTFYRSSSPDKPPFVGVGDTIKEGDVICIVEAMKLFNEIEGEISGKIVKVLADDASPVEYDQPLFLVDPS